MFGERSDVPQHEGAAAAPTIDLFVYHYPLSRADQERLTCLLGAVPALLDQARVNLRDSNARDLWVYSVSTLRQQSEVLRALQAGTLTMRTLEGAQHASLEGAGAALQSAVQRARTATDAFTGWIGSEAPQNTGPSGVGKDNYNWYMQHVHLVPYDDDMRLVMRDPVSHAVAEPRGGKVCEIGEGLGGVAVGPAALVLQRLRQIPVVERDVWCDVTL